MYIRSTVMVFALLNYFVAICISSKGVFLPVLVPLMWFYYRVSVYYRRTSTELQRLSSISRSPIYSHFSETLQGLSSIRALDAVAMTQEPS